MSLNFICKENYSKNGNFCITEEDFYVILLNIIISGGIVFLVYRQYFTQSERRETLSYTCKSPFTILGEGPLSKYYQPVSVQQKTINTKKKMMKNHSSNIISEKANGVNELRCNVCNNSVKVSYQYTLYKFV